MRVFEFALVAVLAALIVACGAAPNGHLRYQLAFDGDPAAAAERVRERLAVVDERENVSLGEVALQQRAAGGLTVDIAVAGGAHCERFDAAHQAVREALTEPEQLSLREVVTPDKAFIAKVQAALGEGVQVRRERDKPYLAVSAPEETDVPAKIAGVASDDVEAAPEAIERYEGGKLVSRRWRIWPIATRSELEADDIEQAKATFSDDDHRPIVQASLTARGAQRFETLTARLTHKYLAILVDGEVMSVPKVMEPIAGGRLQITMGATGRPIAEVFGEAQLLAAGLRSGPIAKNVDVTEQTAGCQDAE